MARAIRASGDVKPKAMRVMSRILVFIDSTRSLERPCSIEAKIAVRCLMMLLCNFTNAGIRHRRAQATRLSRASSVEGFGGLVVGQFEHGA